MSASPARHMRLGWGWRRGPNFIRQKFWSQRPRVPSVESARWSGSSAWSRVAQFNERRRYAKLHSVSHLFHSPARIAPSQGLSKSQNCGAGSRFIEPSRGGGPVNGSFHRNRFEQEDTERACSSIDAAVLTSWHGIYSTYDNTDSNLIFQLDNTII